MKMDSSVIHEMNTFAFPYRILLKYLMGECTGSDTVQTPDMFDYLNHARQRAQNGSTAYQLPFNSAVELLSKGIASMQKGQIV